LSKGLGQGKRIYGGKGGKDARKAFEETPSGKKSKKRGEGKMKRRGEEGISTSSVKWEGEKDFSSGGERESTKCFGRANDQSERRKETTV